MSGGGWPTGMRRFNLRQLKPEPWRNGGGMTRTVASSEVAGQLLWRISAADIAHDSAFSLFPGMQRTAVLMSGGSLLLQGAEPLSLARVGDTVCFAGEAELQARLAHSPALLWNVMVRRSHALAQVQVQQGPAMQRISGGSGELEVLVVLAGQLQVSGDEAGQPFALLPQEGLLVPQAQTPLRESTPVGLHLQSMQPDTRWIHTRVRLLPTATRWPHTGSAAA